MRARFRSWWQQIKRHPVATVLIALLAVVIVLVSFGGYKFNWDWTGFNRPSKTLWDWLQLFGVLAVPVVVGFGAVWFTTRQGKVADAENTDNQRETALQAYIDKMSELLLHEKLRDSAEEDEVRKIARVRTLTILPRLDANRKRSVLQFLYESDLINKGKSIIVLRDADLSDAYMYRANLERANLERANLERANLTYANLSEAYMQVAYLFRADLSAANLSEADLSYANMERADMYGADLFRAKLRLAKLRDADLNEAILSRANLHEVTITLEQLEKAKSLIGATMPDGSIHP